MHFYTVWVRSLSYRGTEPLTYSSEHSLTPGTIVHVPLQKELVLGFIEQSVVKPAFATKAIEAIPNLDPLPAETIQLAKWLRGFYATTLGVVTSLVLPADLPKKLAEDPSTVVEKALAKTTTIPPALTAEQSNVVKNIVKPDTYLIHGKTGSGKTRVYLELAMQSLNANKSAMVLTPEIGLTSQLAEPFRQVFGEQVVVLHSQLTNAQRRKVWLRILTASTPLVIIGPRSALFSPVKQLGLIVIDEAHEPSYKQEQAPYYHARPVASQLAQLHNATLVIGSATPSIGDYYLAQQRQKPILPMASLARASTANHTNTYTVVDLKDRSLFARSPHLSQPLLDAIRQALDTHKQSLIYLNRRGTARVILCENCGWQALCPHCDLPLVYHADSNRFRCHTCGFSQSIVTSCPVCAHPSVTFKSFGTKAITQELHKLFPEATIQRFDTDNAKAERFEQHYQTVKEGSVDILVGTQLLAKGLDLPKLAVLGIVLADSSLYLPDFSSQERTYQLLNQALGRVGRGHASGHAIIQTYHPENAILRAAIQGDWQTFYSTELAERRKFHFPPFYFLLKLSCRRASYKSAETAAQSLRLELENKLHDIEIDGPTPSFHEKLQGKYQCQLVVRSTQRSQLLKAISLLPPSGWSYDIDPINLL